MTRPIQAATTRATMSRRRSVVFIPVAVGALLGSLGAVSVSAAPPTTDASEVVHWNQVAASTLIAFPGPNGGAPPAFQVNMGIVQGAVYDAVNAIGPRHHRSYLLKTRASAKASIDAAVATAAYDVLSNLVSTAPERAPFTGRAGLLAALSTEYAASLGAINAGSSKSQGIAIGHAAAKAMLDARAGDGRFGPSQWTMESGVGKWQPLINPANGLPLLDPTPWVGGVKPFFIQSSSQFRSVPPPALDSAQWAAEFNEVKSLGRADSATRTPDQTYVAKWWQSAPGLSWNEVARQLITRNGLDAAAAARLLALQNMSGADAAINCWNDKYHFDFWRPWNSITTTLDDGNAGTTTDPSWTALITAPYPEWTSGHNCLDASQVSVLRLFFGDTPGSFQITSASALLAPAESKVR
ncbi:MAG TPA: vanadium-dependent haloperoxidase, partial [Jatrophihabitantaceae bacterium]|nr:vanadium-dependent haloperoxidase [Jatrophihabitantaceae bacterium]